MKRSRSTVPLASLSDEQRADIARRHPDLDLGADRDVKPANVLHRDTKPDNVLPAPPSRSRYTGTGAKKGPSANERHFMVWLDLQKAAGRVACWSYELARVVLEVPRSTKKADFWVRCQNGWRLDEIGFHPLVVIELKPADGDTGRPYFGPKGSLSIKYAAKRLAEVQVPLYVAWPNKVDGGWSFEPVEVRS